MLYNIGNDKIIVIVNRSVVIRGYGWGKDVTTKEFLCVDETVLYPDYGRGDSDLYML